MRICRLTVSPIQRRRCLGPKPELNRFDVDQFRPEQRSGGADDWAAAAAVFNPSIRRSSDAGE
jgi:hypothetical protein